ncbi:MAG: alpha-L-fucosidase [Firmicutes bacterium]|nr:alpha-L-fucosidase [Bacillota bacterium]
MSDFEQFLHQASNVKPSERQLRWFDMEMYAFIHFGVNTYTNREWGDGKEDPAIFNPAKFDPDQWVEAVRSAGMKGLILTAKHHDGFCLWPSAYTEHCVRNASVKTDIVGAVSKACQRGGIRFGIYLSPWDRNCPLYGSDAYNDYYCHQLEELLTSYGELFTVWFDGACGEGPNGKKQVYDFPRYIRLIRELQPHAVIFNDHGPDFRWVGNESGSSRHAEWAVVPSELCDFADIQTGPGPLSGDLSYMYNSDPDVGSLPNILYSKGLVFCPSETDMSIRSGWFYHPDEEPHSLERLWDTYLRTVGGNTCLNLNIPPTPEGLLDEKDVRRLKEFGDKIRLSFSNEVSEEARIREEIISPTQKRICVCFDRPVDLAYVTLQENLQSGQRVENFQLRASLYRGDEKVSEKATVYQGTTIGHKKICPLFRKRRNRTTDTEPLALRTDYLEIAITASRGEADLLPVRIWAKP